MDFSLGQTSVHFSVQLEEKVVDHFNLWKLQTFNIVRRSVFENSLWPIEPFHTFRRRHYKMKRFIILCKALFFAGCVEYHWKCKIMFSQIIDLKVFLNELFIVCVSHQRQSLHIRKACSAYPSCFLHPEVLYLTGQKRQKQPFT